MQIKFCIEVIFIRRIKMSNSIKNIIKVKGVNCKGYGIILKAVMQDTELSLTSKAIYAYFCSYTGSGTSIFPSRERILSDLKLSKNGYYSHYNALQKQGYLKVEKKRGYINKNVYTLINNPKKLKDVASNGSESRLKIKGMNTQGYGFIPKAIMLDDRIDVKAKGLIAYFYAIAQNGNVKFPAKKDILYHLGISNTAYYNALNQLIKYNYITITQRKSTDGKFAVNDYELNTFPEEQPCTQDGDIINDDNLPCVQNEDNIENKLNTPCVQNEDNTVNKPNTPCVQNEDNTKKTPCSYFGYIQNEDNNNITCINNTLSNVSINHTDSTKSEMTDNDIEDEAYKKGLPITSNKEHLQKSLITLTMLKDIEASEADKQYISVYRMAVNCLNEMILSDKMERYRGSCVSSAQVIEKLGHCYEDDEYGLSLRDFLFEVVLRYINAQENYHINNPINYMKSVLWTSMYCYGV